MQIKLEFDSQAQAASQSFRDAIQAAATILDNTFVDDITVNISVGYGEIEGQSISPSNSAEGGPDRYGMTSYSVVRSALANSLAPEVRSGVAALPSGSAILGHSTVEVWSAEQKALGLMSATDPGLDGAVGFGTDFGNAGTTSALELTAVALHELTHAMGRVTDDGSYPDIFDFYRFTSPGNRLLDGANTSPLAYFSLDGGNTTLAQYDTSSDPGDFNFASPLTTNDSFNAGYNSSTLSSLTSVDILQMEALGFHIQPPAQPFLQSSVAFVNPTTGDWGFLTPSSTGSLWQDVGASSTAFTAIGSGDFNGDGSRDLAFRDLSTGDLGFMTPGATGGETWHPVGQTSTAFAVIGIGDFNGDGASDLMFQNKATGDIGYMSMNGVGETWHAMGQTSLAFTACGAGDFLGDGQVGELFRNTATGDIGFMTPNPGGGETWHPIGQTSTAFSVIGIGDFDGSGQDEVAFRDAAGDWGYMSANPGGGETWRAVGQTSTAFNAVKVADFDGSGHDEIAFVNPTTGDTGYMAVDLAGGQTWHALGTISTDYYGVA